MSDSADRVRTLLVLAPIAPAPTGNGLAMRTDLFRRSAPPTVAVRTIVIPVAGRLPDGVRTAPHVTLVQERTAARLGLVGLVADPAWRGRLEQAGTLPERARSASPGLAESVVAAIEVERPLAVHVVRSYLAPLGAVVADRLAAEWATLDLDEDDGALASALGRTDEAAANDRLLDTFAPLFDGLSASSAAEAESIGRRHGLEVAHVPNAVDVPKARPPRRGSPTGDVSLVFVGNLTYPPNLAAAQTLAEAILPALRRRLAGRARLLLIGPHDGHLTSLAGPDVEVTGFVPSLDPVYAAADAAVVPLDAGAGTRIKILEAFAHGVPVVASTIAAGGLACADGQHLLVADGPEQTAAAVQQLVTDPGLADRLAEAAYSLVCDRYSTDAVAPLVRSFFDCAAQRSSDRHTAGPG